MATIPVPPGRATAKRRVSAFRQGLRNGDTFAQIFTLLCAVSILLVTVALVYELYINSKGALHQFGFGFLTGRTWDPVSGDFGALPFIYGTVVTSALAMLMTIPLGVGAAIFLSELAPTRISNALTFVIETPGGGAQCDLRVGGLLYPGAVSSSDWRAISEAHLGISAPF